MPSAKLDRASTVHGQIDRTLTRLDHSSADRAILISRDTLSDLLRSVRLRGAVFYYVSFRDRWSAEAPQQGDRRSGDAGLRACHGVHMIAKGGGGQQFRARRP